jgi:hypothetical protein
MSISSGPINRIEQLDLDLLDAFSLLPDTEDLSGRSQANERLDQIGSARYESASNRCRCCRTEAKEQEPALGPRLIVDRITTLSKETLPSRCFLTFKFFNPGGLKSASLIQ